MAILKRTRRAGLLAIGIPLLAYLAFAWGHASSDVAQADGAAMSLAVPGAISCDADKCSVDGSQTFVLHVVSDSLPPDGTAGYSTEVLLSSGLEWKPRENCSDEVQAGREDGDPLQTCLAVVTTLLEAVGHTVLGEVGIPPLALLDVTEGGTLVEIDVNCLSMESHQVTLVAVPDSPFGTTYSDPNAVPIFLKTEDFDYDGDTTPNAVGDTLTINCEEPPPATDTPTPTETLPTDLPTDVPQATDTPEPTSVVGAVSAGFGPIDGDGGVSAGLWAVIGAMLAAAATGLIILGWPKRAYATVSAAVATSGPALPATTRVGSDTNFGLWPIVGAVMATGLAVFGWKFTRRGR